MAPLPVRKFQIVHPAHQAALRIQVAHAQLEAMTPLAAGKTLFGTSSSPIKPPPLNSPKWQLPLNMKESSTIIRKAKINCYPAGPSVKPQIPKSVLENENPNEQTLAPVTKVKTYSNYSSAKPSPPLKTTVLEKENANQRTLAPVIRATMATLGTSSTPASYNIKKSPSPLPKTTVLENENPNQQTLAPVTKAKTSYPGSSRTLPSYSINKSAATSREKPSASVKNVSPASNNDKSPLSGSSRRSTRNTKLKVQMAKMTEAQLTTLALQGNIAVKDSEMLALKQNNDKN